MKLCVILGRPKYWLGAQGLYVMWLLYWNNLLEVVCYIAIPA